MKSPTERGCNLDNNYIGENLRYLRKKKGVTQTEVAKALGIPTTTYNAYETGQNVPRDEVKLKIANYFNRTVQFIFFNRITH
jgi:DNA-binding XRE family transcriptional regulator